MDPRPLRHAASSAVGATTVQRLAIFSVTSVSCILVLGALRFVYLQPGQGIYLPAYLAFIYLFRYCSMRAILDPDSREHFYIAFGLAISIVRYFLIFTPMEPYVDILTIATFYCFAYSQALILRDSLKPRRIVNAIFLASAVAFALMVIQYAVFLRMGPHPFLLDRTRIETQVGPVWLLASVGSLIMFLLNLHIRAALEIDDFAIRLRLGFLIVTWLLFLVFFLLDEGVHFGWFGPHKHISDILLILPMICVLHGLAMPRWVERLFTGLYFLDRRTSRELTLFVLTRIVRNSTGSALTELAMATAERLKLSPEEQQQIFLACEFLEAPCPTGTAIPVVGAPWESLAVASVPEHWRLAAEQQLVYKAWRVKRAVELGAPGRSLPARVIAAARGFLIGKEPGGSDEAYLWHEVCRVAQESALTPEGLSGAGAAVTIDERLVPACFKSVSQRTRPTQRK